MKAKNEASILARHIATFLNEYAPKRKTESANTLKGYTDTLTLYLQFLESKGVTPLKLEAECFKRGWIEQWLDWLKNERKNQPDTCNNRLASLRTFLKYLGDTDIRFLSLYQDAAMIERLPVQKKKVTGLSRNAVKALLATPDLKKKSGRRDLALILMLYSTAARIDEVLSLKICHLHLEAHHPYVTFVGKGNKVRTLYLLERAVKHLQKYLQEFHGRTPASEAYVFYSRNEGIHGKLTASAVDKMLKKVALKAHEVCAEVPLSLHAHQFRHAKASHWLQDGVNLLQISFLLGHEQVQTTMVYLDITKEDEFKALATVEDDKDLKLERKWKSNASLRDFCGLSKQKRER